MGMNFPDLPTNGQVFGVYTYDGEKWTITAGPGGPSPSNTNPIMDGTAAPGTASPYSRGDHVHPSDTSKASTASVALKADTTYVDTQDALKLSKSANLSDVADATTSRKSIYAAPFDALAYNGMQINGSMEVSQEVGTGTISGVVNTQKFIIDRWKVASAGVQSMSGALNPAAPPGFAYSLQVFATTANASPAAGDYAVIQQNIEGYRVIRLAWGTANAQPITLGFWVYVGRAGNYSGSVGNVAGTRSQVFTFTVNAANTFEYKTVTISGCTDGVWAKDNTAGLIVSFALMVGTTYQTAAGAWATGVYLGAPGTFNGVASTVSDTMLLTGVVVLPGIEAPAAARSPLIMRPYNQELMTCKRYYQKILAAGAAAANATTTVYGWGFPFPVELRTTPTASLSATASWTTPTQSFTTAAIANNNCSVSTWNVNVTANGNVASSVAVCLGGAYCVADARL